MTILCTDGFDKYYPLHQDGEGEQTLRKLLQHFTYKPDWEFNIFQGVLVISALVVDSTDKSRSTTIIFRRALPDVHYHRDFDWKRWLFNMIMEVERHEAQEFFQFHGVPPYDPHKGD